MTGTEIASATGNEVTTLNHNHPLYLQASDAPGIVLVPIKLTGPENYAQWSRSMKLALRGKGKLGFVDGSYAKASYKGVLEEQWEKCNAIVLSWIASTVTGELLPGIIYASNTKKVWADFEERFDRSDLTRIYHLWSEIAALKQGIDSVTSYYSKLRDLWAELDVMIPSPGCACEDSAKYVEHLRSQRLLQFLMGLNESFGHIRSSMLARKPVITVNEAYAVAAQEESQRTLGVLDKTRDPLTLLAGRTQGGRPKPKKFVPPGTICDHCGFKGHFKADCYRLVGYPPDFQSKRKGSDGFNERRGTEGFKSDFKPNAHFTRNAESDFKPNAHFTRNADDFTKATENQMSSSQYEDLVNRMDKASTSDCAANMSGTLRWQGIGDW